MRRPLLRGRALRVVHGERSGYPGFETRHRGTYVETEENRRGLLRGQGLEGSGGGAPGPGGGVLGKCERFTGLDETPPQVGVFQVASRSRRVPSPIHSFSRSLDTSFMLMSGSGARAAETGQRSGPSDLPVAVSIHLPLRSPHVWGHGHGYSVARPLPVLCRRKASGSQLCGLCRFSPMQ